MGRLVRRRHVVESPAERAGAEAPEPFNFTRDVVEVLAIEGQRRALRFVDAQGVIDKRTFYDIASAAGRWAALLRSRGLEPGDRVLVLLGPTPAWPAVLFGALKAGLVPVLCPQTTETAGLALRLGDSGARMLVVDESCAREGARAGHPRRRARLRARGNGVTASRRRPADARHSGHRSGPDPLARGHGGSASEPRRHARGAPASRERARHLRRTTSSGAWQRWARRRRCGMDFSFPGPPEPRPSSSTRALIGSASISSSGSASPCCVSLPAEFRQMVRDPARNGELGGVRRAVSLGEPLDPAVADAFQAMCGLTVDASTDDWMPAEDAAAPVALAPPPNGLVEVLHDPVGAGATANGHVELTQEPERAAPEPGASTEAEADRLDDGHRVEEARRTEEERRDAERQAADGRRAEEERRAAEAQVKADERERKQRERKPRRKRSSPNAKQPPRPKPTHANASARKQQPQPQPNTPPKKHDAPPTPRRKPTSANGSNARRKPRRKRGSPNAKQPPRPKPTHANASARKQQPQPQPNTPPKKHAAPQQHRRKWTNGNARNRRKQRPRKQSSLNARRRENDAPPRSWPKSTNANASNARRKPRTKPSSPSAGPRRNDETLPPRPKPPHASVNARKQQPRPQPSTQPKKHAAPPAPGQRQTNANGSNRIRKRQSRPAGTRPSAGRRSARPKRTGALPRRSGGVGRPSRPARKPRRGTRRRGSAARSDPNRSALRARTAAKNEMWRTSPNTLLTERLRAYTHHADVPADRPPQ